MFRLLRPWPAGAAAATASTAQVRAGPPARSLGPAWRAVLPAFYRRPGGLRWIPGGRAACPPARTGGSGISAFPPASQLPIDEQVDCLRAAANRNPTLTEVLTRAAALDLPGWYLVAGALCQTVWNVTTGQPPEAGILDYDLVYFDASDLSWEAEDAVIKRGEEVFAGLPAPVQIRNQARVHLWYESRFGIPCPPHTSSEAAISTYEATAACLGVRLLPGGRWRVFAPYGLSDLLGLVLRPNPALAPRQVYEAKVARWTGQWPELTVLPWP